MARANRHFIAGHIWHLTHRCHKREFLLKFSKDRTRWMELLREAKKRYQLSILNFIVTSNHAHVIVSENSGNDSIPRAMQLIAGRTGQGYNLGKGRKGAFWEDRYHATAIESGEHLWQCLVYVDLNMVRGLVLRLNDFILTVNILCSPPRRGFNLVSSYVYMQTESMTHWYQLSVDKIAQFRPGALN